MPTIYFPDFHGNIESAEAEDAGAAFTVAHGPRAGAYPKDREDRFGKGGFCLHKEHAERFAIDLLQMHIARQEQDLSVMEENVSAAKANLTVMKQKLEQLGGEE
jgi:hypothetical protein